MPAEPGCQTWNSFYPLSLMLQLQYLGSSSLAPLTPSSLLSLESSQ